MKPGLWAEIHRLHEIEGITRRQIAKRLGCSRNTVAEALASPLEPPKAPQGRRSKLDPYLPKIDALLAQYPQLSAERIAEELRPHGYTGGLTILRELLRERRPKQQRIYQEVNWSPGEAMEVDWGACGKLEIEGTIRRVSVFVAVLCYSRMLYIRFFLDEVKESFYLGIVSALAYFGGSPRKIIIDNLKAGVLDGHGQTARFHPEFLALCGTYRMQPIACARRDPESKGMVEGGVRYVKGNALAGRELANWGDYSTLAEEWLLKVNRRLHRTTGRIPVEALAEEGLRPLPATPYDATRIESVVVTSHARVSFDGNKYSVPPEVVGTAVIIQADMETVRILKGAEELARHRRSWGRKLTILHPAHQAAALAKRKRHYAGTIESRFVTLGAEARAFREGLSRTAVKSLVHMREILRMARLYGRAEVLQALGRACEYGVYDKAYVLNLIEQARRKANLPTPLPLVPRRLELLEETDFTQPDPSMYDNLSTGDTDEE